MPDPNDCQLPPHNPEAERCVLGSMIRSNLIIGDVVQIVRVEDFYTYANQLIFAAALHLYDHGKPVDVVTLANELTERKQMEEVKAPYLGELWRAVPYAGHAVHYAHIVREKSIMRRLILAAHEIANDAQNQSGPAEELLDQAEKKIFSIAQAGLGGQTVDIQTMIRQAYDRIDERIRRSRDGECCARGISTGFVELDGLTSGLQNSELILIAARPSVGKTAFGLCLVRHIAVDLGLPAFFVSLEQSQQELSERLLCCQGLVDSHKLRSGFPTDEEYQRLIAASSALRKSRQWYFDGPNQAMLQIAAAARRYKRSDGIRLMVLDYLQLIEGEGRKQNRYEEISMISRRLKLLARELQIPLVALAQLNRGPEERATRRPRLSDLRDSGSLEQDADVVMFLYRTKQSDPSDDRADYSDTEEIGVMVEKQRNGPRGEVKLTFKKKFMRFENYAPEVQREPAFSRNGPD